QIRPIVVLDAITCDNRSGTIFSTAAMDEYGFCFAAEQIRQDYFQLRPRGCRPGTQRDVHIFESEIMNLYALSGCTVPLVAQINYHFDTQGPQFLECNGRGRCASIEMITQRAKIAHM